MFDPIVDGGDAGVLAQMLERAGAEVTHQWQENGHELSRVDIDDAREWLERLA